MISSSQVLVEAISGWRREEVQALIALMRSRLSPTSRAMAARYARATDIPPAGSPARHALADEIVALLGWYGANAFAYAGRCVVGEPGGATYLALLRDVAHWLERTLPRQSRRPIPKAISTERLEERIVDTVCDKALSNCSAEELEQVLHESGVGHDVVAAVMREHAKRGAVGLGLTVIVRLAGEQAARRLLEQVMLSQVMHFAGRAAVRELARTLLARLSTRWIPLIGWALLVAEGVVLLSRPARRITCRAVPFIAMIRVRQRLMSDAEASASLGHDPLTALPPRNNAHDAPTRPRLAHAAAVNGRTSAEADGAASVR